MYITYFKFFYNTTLKIIDKFPNIIIDRLLKKMGFNLSYTYTKKIRKKNIKNTKMNKNV